MTRLTIYSAVLIVFGCLPDTIPDAAAEPEKPELSEQEIAQRCRDALRDLHTFCAHEFHRRSLRLSPGTSDLHETQQIPRGPGSEYPELPRSNERFECLDARRRVDKFCFQEKDKSRGNVVSDGKPVTPSI